ncbi:MAG TPA: peptidoglycan DD-metalloendopeptidase family protein [Steroidobacteraceae bacterium]|nr:peptidoglycan DD-metalloendopeptidase family protein [Steroidobacteraceae bacterium]
MRRSVAAVVVLALLAGCASTPPRTPRYYLVRPSDTLYSIAWRNRLDYRELAAWNRIGPGYRIYAGERLRLRPPRGFAARSAGPGRKAMPRTPPRAAVRIRPPPPPPAPGARSAAAAAVRWTWPTARSGSVRRLVNGALLIGGRLGEIVHAAAAGRVVYTGTGIPGFGLLVIIKHDANVLSAYAYNAAVLVHEGQQVAAGEPIARMGTDSRQAPLLYFEIRANGRTVDPLPYLPSR